MQFCNLKARQINIMEKIISTEWLGRKLTIKTGKLAQQADAAVLVQYGETVVMATVVQNKQAREGIHFFPLMVEFQERFYAAGIIKGSRWIKREGRPSDDSVLTGRMIDRTIRPLFNQDDRRDVQVILTPLALDQENDYDIVALIAASAVLSISGIEWKGPISGIRVARIENEFIFNPSYEQQNLSDLDLIVAGTKNKTIMIEAGANEIKEEEMFKAIIAGQEKMQVALELIEKLKEEIKPKEIKDPQKLKSADDVKKEEEKDKVLQIAETWLKENINKILFTKEYYSKGERKAAVIAIKDGLDKYLFEQDISDENRSHANKSLVEKLIDEEITRAIVEEGKRVDGRALDEIRDLNSEVAILPRDHGTSLFSRGETQVMSIVTLGPPGMEQSLEGMDGKSKKRFMHHYNFPPYSVGEASPIRGTGRREIGHGALAEKALLPVMPDTEDFPYAIRVVSETLGSNGSSSMASTCAATLALMDAGVPIKKPVTGVAMGLASYPDMSKWSVLTDIQDLEDGNGGMDFKITGTDAGLTSIQLDTKTEGISPEIIKQTLQQGRQALNEILKVMTEAIASPREELSPYAPRIVSFKVDPEKIGSIIGPGGKIINKIIDETGVSIDIEDDGLVIICGSELEKVNEAVNQVKDIVRVFEAGEIIKGEVIKLMDFGAFVQLNANQDGLIRVSELAPYYVSSPENILKVGDKVTVKIIEIDEQGRINLSMKGIADNASFWENEKGKGSPSDRNNNFTRRNDSNRFNRRDNGPRRPRF